MRGYQQPAQKREKRQEAIAQYVEQCLRNRKKYRQPDMLLASGRQLNHRPVKTMEARRECVRLAVIQRQKM